MKDTFLNAFYFIALVGIVLHFIFAHVAHTVLQRRQIETDEIFSSNRFVYYGTPSMRVRLFFPWVPVHSIAEQPAHVHAIVWAARLGGTAIFLGFLGMLATHFLPFIAKG